MSTAAASTPTLRAPPLAQQLTRAAEVLRAVREGQSATEALARLPEGARAATHALSFIALRRLGLALALRRELAPKAPKPAVEALLLTTLALLSLPAASAPYAEHTLVNQAVVAARALPGAAGPFVNAVLRRFLREREALMALAERDEVARYNHPAWWIARVRADEGSEASLLAAHQPAPMVLRVNRRHGDVEGYLKRLQAAGHMAVAIPTPGVPAAESTAIHLIKPCAVQLLPGFATGDVSVQDAAAQTAAHLVVAGLRASAARPAPWRVLDACAAPGGKTAHLLELEPTLELTALDSDRERLVRLRENLARLRLQDAAPAQRQGQPSVQAQVLVGDAADPKLGWWDGRPFDAILVDAPCSASGIVRRHPDIVWLRRESDIAALAATQARMLDNLWPLLAPGGVLVYATCSVFKAEGAQQIDAFMQRQTNDPPTLDPASPGHLRPLPDNRPSGGAAGALTTQAPDPFSTHHEPGATHDGFYYARLVKRR